MRVTGRNPTDGTTRSFQRRAIGLPITGESISRGAAHGADKRLGDRQKRDW